MAKNKSSRFDANEMLMEGLDFSSSYETDAPGIPSQPQSHKKTAVVTTSSSSPKNSLRTAKERKRKVKHKDHQISVNLSKTLHEDFKTICMAKEVTVNGEINRIMKEYVLENSKYL